VLPACVLTGARIVKVACGGDFTYALSSDGDVYALRASTALLDAQPAPQLALVPENVQSSGGWWTSLTAWLGGSAASSGVKPSRTVVAGLPGSANAVQLVGPSSGSDGMPSVPSLRAGETFVDVSAGRDHALLLTSAGRVLTLAQNAAGNALGQLGAGHDKPGAGINALAFEAVGRGAVAVAAGGEHSMALLESGDVLVWGSNRFLQLGIGDYRGKYSAGHVEHHCSPRMMAGLWTRNGDDIPERPAGELAVRIAAGGDVSAVVVRDVKDECARLFMCGHGLYGALGTGKVRCA
jgi:alpha-tubulin suppressor-like RCC1 family protein